MSTDTAGLGARQGLSWSWELDFDALARCIGDEGSAGGADGERPGGGVEDAGPGCAVEDAEPGGVEDGVGDEEAVQRAVLAAVAERGGERVPAGALAGALASRTASTTWPLTAAAEAAPRRRLSQTTWMDSAAVTATVKSHPRRWLLAIRIRPRPARTTPAEIIEFMFTTVLVLSVLPATVI